MSEDKDSGAKDLTGAFDLWSSIFGATDEEGDGSWEKAGAEERCRGRSWRRMSEVTLVSKERGPRVGEVSPASEKREPMQEKDSGAKDLPGASSVFGFQERLTRKGVALEEEVGSGSGGETQE